MKGRDLGLESAVGNCLCGVLQVSTHKARVVQKPGRSVSSRSSSALKNRCFQIPQGWMGFLTIRDFRWMKARGIVGKLFSSPFCITQLTKFENPSIVLADIFEYYGI